MRRAIGRTLLVGSARGAQELGGSSGSEKFLGCFLFHHTPPKTNRISTFGSDWESADLVYMIIYDSFEEG